MNKFVKPYGYLTSGDIAQFGVIRGLQVHNFLQDYGVEIDGRMMIKESQYRALAADGTVARYKKWHMTCVTKRGTGQKIGG